MIGKIIPLEQSKPSARLLTNNHFQQAQITKLNMELRESRCRHRTALQAAEELERECAELRREIVQLRLEASNDKAQNGILINTLRDLLIMLQGHAGVINEHDHPEDFRKLAAAYNLLFGGDCTVEIPGTLYAELAI